MKQEHVLKRIHILERQISIFEKKMAAEEDPDKEQLLSDRIDLMQARLVELEGM